MRMFLKGKLKIIPHRIKGIEEVKGIFERSRATQGGTKSQGLGNKQKGQNPK